MVVIISNLQTDFKLMDNLIQSKSTKAKLPFPHPGCTTGSTHVEAQLKEVKDVGQKENREPGNQPADRSRTNKYTYGQMKNRLDADQAVFKVYKGVKCFDFSKDKNIIVTGGMDRIVRLWNPYVSG